MPDDFVSFCGARLGGREGEDEKVLETDNSAGSAVEPTLLVESSCRKLSSLIISFLAGWFERDLEGDNNDARVCDSKASKTSRCFELSEDCTIGSCFLALCSRSEASRFRALCSPSEA